MNRMLALFIASVFAWQAHAAPPSGRAGAVIGEELAGLGRTASYDAKEAPATLAGLAKADAKELEKAKIKADFDALQLRAKALKAADDSYFAPWSPEAKRLDWQARDTILAANRPLSMDELAESLNVESDRLALVMLKDKSNTRKVFFHMSDGKVWVSSTKLPSGAKLTQTVTKGGDIFVKK